ncbi:hypothetical protein MLD38_022867 [Melastoma candidum]|uniref:Uncharacterized protein n=1 Tax=Melastoma candidum TaxID=119954 RepID=A0ACB9QKL2_9MYRT|nr:hypothetical protein MLD38_022867 [Melastoma candidum]
MYDTLYTRAPILYTWLGMTGRTFIVCCIASVVWIFSATHDVHWHDVNTRYTFAILIAVLTYELYQTVQIPFSDWGVVKMIRLRGIRIMWKIIDFVATIRISRKRWSGTMGQLNLFDYSHRAVFWKPVEKLLPLFKIEEVRKKFWFERVEIPKFFKGKLLCYMNKFEENRKEQPFTMRGDWTFEIYQITKGGALSSSIEQGFDKSIITWHIATEICLQLLNVYDREGNGPWFVKMISNYMMYLAALRPQLLSLTTTDITVRYARKKINPLTDLSLRSFEDVRNDWLQNIEIEDGSSREIDHRETQKNNDSDTLEIDETIITSKWDVLSDARKLAKELQDMDDEKWEVMGSIWTEMLCYAAYHCQVYHHSKMLWSGGELITHVWLILLHKTDKYRIKDKNDALRTLLKQKKKKGLKTFLCF